MLLESAVIRVFHQSVDVHHKLCCLTKIDTFGWRLSTKDYEASTMNWCFSDEYPTYFVNLLHFKQVFQNQI